MIKAFCDTCGLEITKENIVISPGTSVDGTAIKITVDSPKDNHICIDCVIKAINKAYNYNYPTESAE